jgi:hypothetical protein
MYQTDQMLATAIVGILTEADPLSALGLDDVISAPTAPSGRTRHGKGGFSNGFFSGPLQRSRRVSSNGNGSAHRKVDDVDAVPPATFATWCTVTLNHAGQTGLAGDADHRPSAPANGQRNEQLFAGFWQGPRQYRRHMWV